MRNDPNKWTPNFVYNYNWKIPERQNTVVSVSKFIYIKLNICEKKEKSNTFGSGFLVSDMAIPPVCTKLYTKYQITSLVSHLAVPPVCTELMFHKRYQNRSPVSHLAMPPVCTSIKIYIKCWTRSHLTSWPCHLFGISGLSFCTHTTSRISSIEGSEGTLSKYGSWYSSCMPKICTMFSQMGHSCNRHFSCSSVFIPSATNHPFNHILEAAGK